MILSREGVDTRAPLVVPSRLNAPKSKGRPFAPPPPHKEDHLIISTTSDRKFMRPDAAAVAATATTRPTPQPYYRAAAGGRGGARSARAGVTMTTAPAACVRDMTAASSGCGTAPVRGGDYGSSRSWECSRGESHARRVL